jgi:predicted metal-dependent phosphoesterase TrpH
LNIELIPAVELSVQYDVWQDVHLLGYGLDYSNRDFLRRLNGFREQRVHRNDEILARVNGCLIAENLATIGLDEVLLHAMDVIGRPHIARALLARGYVKTVEDAFRRYLVPCNIPKHYWPINDAIAEIRRLGGVAVLAHPTSVSTDRQDLRRIITDLAEQGLDGVEVFNNLAQGDEMEFLRRRTEEAGLLITGGSDFHGIEQGLQMGRGRGGVRFSDTLLAPLRKRLSERQHT